MNEISQEKPWMGQGRAGMRRRRSPPVNQTTLNSTYNEKKYAEILLRYRWLFIKDDFIIGRVECITQTSELSKKISEVSKIEKKLITHPNFTTPVQSVDSPSKEVINRKLMMKDIPFYPDPMYRPPLKPTRISTLESPENIDINPEINVEFKENSRLQGLISQTYQRPVSHSSKNLENWKV